MRIQGTAVITAAAVGLVGLSVGLNACSEGSGSDYEREKPGQTEKQPVRPAPETTRGEQNDGGQKNQEPNQTEKGSSKKSGDDSGEKNEKKTSGDKTEDESKTKEGASGDTGSGKEKPSGKKDGSRSKEDNPI